MMNKEKKIPEDYIDSDLDQFDLLDSVIPAEVCHYTRMDIALEKILFYKQIRLGCLADTRAEI